MNDIVFISENRLTVVDEPRRGSAMTTSASMAARRMPTSTRPRVECGSGSRQTCAKPGRLVAHAGSNLPVGGVGDVGDDAVHGQSRRR